ncbi:hypothetical protein CEXT_34571 [Caerostris extrusa]|uniref:Uncharacterized protein n=1 Tax=Caerostris extrusa TaxID=172846 RepID=A0AAV4XHY9_CAEEX|nr:hypothetical protein CEXT_34571 [Caerostris extrusa]
MVRSREIRDHGYPDKEIKSAPGGTVFVNDSSLRLMNVVGNCMDTYSSSLPAGMSARSCLRGLSMCEQHISGL